MKKVLLLTLNSCYPLYHGGALAQYYFLDGLKDKVEFVLCTIVSNDKEFQNIETLKKKQPLLKVYFFDARVPQKKKSLKKKITSKVFVIYHSLFSKKTINAQSKIDVDDYADSYFLTVDKPQNPAFIALFNEVIVKENIQQVQFDFYDTMDYCFAVPAGVRKIFIHHELRFKRLKLAASSSSLPDSFKNYLIEKTEAYERMCVREMDEVVVFNQDDAKLLTADSKHITVSPFAIPDELIFKKNVSDVFNCLFFVGGEGHNPNKLGLLWFLDTIYIPNIDKIPYPINVVGDWSELIKEKYKGYSNIIFCGLVDSMEPYFDNSIFVNPILTGAGLRTKVLHAYINKVPVLSTRFGAEGCFDENNNSHLGLFDNAEEFIQILQKTDFKAIGLKGYEYYNQNFNKDNLLKIRFDLYNR
jgi:hypothetical protein